MIPTLEPEAKYIHPLARFVTKEAIAKVRAPNLCRGKSRN